MTLLAAIVGVAWLAVPTQANAQRTKTGPTLQRTIAYIVSKLPHLNVHYYSESEAGLPKTGRRVNVTSIRVSKHGRLELITETSSAPTYLPSHRYKVVMCLSHLSAVSSGQIVHDSSPRNRRSQPFQFWLMCKNKGQHRRSRCVESHWLDEKAGKTVRMFSEYRIRVSRKDERQGPKLMRAFDHLRRLHLGKKCRRDREPF